MNNTVYLVSKLYGGSRKLHFVSDIYGNILWTSFEGIKIIFPEGLDYEKHDGEAAKILVDGEPMSAYCSVAWDDTHKYYIWTAFTPLDILKVAGKTETYFGAIEMLSTAMQNLEIILKRSDLLQRDIPEELKHIAAEQQPVCLNLMRSVEALKELVMAIYEKGNRTRAMSMYNDLCDVVRECNLVIGKKGRTMKTIFSDRAKLEFVTAGKKLLYVMLLILVRRTLFHTPDKEIIIQGHCDKQNMYVRFSYIYPEKTMYQDVSEELEFHCALLYARYLGGDIILSNDNIMQTATLKLPLYNKVELCAPPLYVDIDLTHLTQIFLSGVEDKLDEAGDVTEVR